jgi:integrase
MSTMPLHTNAYLAKLPDDLRAKTLDFYLSLNMELSDRTKLEYCRVFTQLTHATKDAPMMIHSKGKWLQARAVRNAMLRGGFLSEHTKIWGLSDKWRRHEGSRAAKIKEKLIASEVFQQILAVAPRGISPKGQQHAPDTRKGQEFRLACILAYYAGMRRTEIVHLRPEHITELPTGHFKIHIAGATTKNNEPHDTYLPSWFAADVAQFRHWGGFTIDENYISTSFWYLTRKKLHITTNFHALRHSAVTLNWKGLEGKEKQAMLGHKDYATTRIYDHIEPGMPKGLVERWSAKKQKE